MADDDECEASLWLQIVRAYTINFPIQRGKGRLFKLAKRFCRVFPEAVTVATRDGRKISVGFRDWADDQIFFLGTYEKFCTELTSGFINKDSICFDVGANIGWYTTLFQSICGVEGEVHSFEPVPSSFRELERNVRLNLNTSKVFLNNFGLGDERRDAEIYLFPEFPSGHASLAANRNSNATDTIKIKIVTLNQYLAERQIDHVDLIKIDIEGAELMFLKGATALFEQQTPPVMLMEMSPETCNAFDYEPEDLLRFISRRASYDFFALDEQRKKKERIWHFANGRDGANVLCVPSAR